MFRKPLFWETFISLAAVGALNYIAVRFHLYWSSSEFDSIVHFMGGTTLSFAFLWLYFFSGYFLPRERSLAKFLTVSILGSLFVSIAWEIYELVLGEATMNKAEYPFDTTLDLVMDFLGAIAACFYAYLREMRQSGPNPSFETKTDE